MPEGYQGFTPPERKCSGVLIANNVVVTSPDCCEDIYDLGIIDTSGGTNGMINTNARYGGLGAHTAHLSMSFFGSSFVCKNGQKKNGKCKKPGKRRRRDDSDEEPAICILRALYNIAEAFKTETIKDRSEITFLMWKVSNAGFSRNHSFPQETFLEFQKIKEKIII